MGSKPAPGFLSARWVHLVMLNYEVDVEVLRALVPRGTELDAYNDRHFVSMVGFQFLGTRVMGIAVPFHRSFDEVNLRFYVRRVVDGELRRGVVFVKEIVSRRVAHRLDHPRVLDAPADDELLDHRLPRPLHRQAGLGAGERRTERQRRGGKKSDGTYRGRTKCSVNGHDGWFLAAGRQIRKSRYDDAPLLAPDLPL